MSPGYPARSLPVLIWAAIPELVMVATVSLGLGVIIWLVLVGKPAHHAQIRANLTRAGATRAAATTADVPGRKPVQLAGVSRRLMPPGYLRWLDTLIERAGRPDAWPIERVLSLKAMGAVVGLVAALTLATRIPGAMGVLLGLGSLGLFAMAPDLLLYSRGSERSAAIQLELPDLLDQMSIAVEAGLGFDAAMNRVARSSATVLGQEFTRTLQEIQVGQSRRVAYEELNDRTRCDDLKRFTRSIIQAETYGLAMTEVLRTQADEMRVRRRQRAEEKAMQIPVKVTIPLMLFILPVLFIVVLGPVALNLVP